MTYETLTEIEWEQVNHIWDLLDQSEVDRARLELKSLYQKRPGHPDLRIVDAAVALDEGEPLRALEALKGAERSADPAHFFHMRASALYEMCRFGPAREDAERALTIRPELADTHSLLARVCDHLGEATESSRHTEEAHELDPETFLMPLEVANDEFDRVVLASVAELPAEVRKHLNDLPVLVEDLPRPEYLGASPGAEPGAESSALSPDVLGLFIGRDLLSRTHDQSGEAPGAIFLFRKNLLRVCADREELIREIRITVQHEVGHLLGLDEDDLEQWGLA